MSIVKKRIVELGFEMPVFLKPAGIYLLSRRFDNFVITSGQGPKVDGKVVYHGKVGKDLTMEDAYKAAQIACLNCLASIEIEIGNLDNIVQVVSLLGFVNSTPNFVDQAKVMDGASHLLLNILGERGKGARMVIGSNVLPNNMAVEIQLIVEVE
ncbi:MAG: RidA family protein [Firmicutes bacterium]|nr:RidA family protein [Bacillota bacterium]